MTNADLQDLQQKYERWSQLYQQQLEAQTQFLEAERLFDELQTYYLDPQWMADREADLPLEHSGEAHSIFSEDALWNMLTDRNELATKWMRLGLDAIDKG